MEKPKGTISRVLEEAGIKDFDEMTAEEKITLGEYQEVLSRKEVKMDDLKRFVKVNLKKLREENEELDISPLKTIYIKARIRNLVMLDALIFQPLLEKERLIKELKNRFKLN